MDKSRVRLHTKTYPTNTLRCLLREESKTSFSGAEGLNTTRFSFETNHFILFDAMAVVRSCCLATVVALIHALHISRGCIDTKL